MSISSRVWAAALVLFLSCAVGTFAVSEDSLGTQPPRIHRVLMNIKLGSSLARIERTYPPTKFWPMEEEPNEKIVRIQWKREDSETFPKGIEKIVLAMAKNRVIKIKAVYSLAQTRKEPLSEVVKRLSDRYGEPEVSGTAYIWRDRHTILKAYEDVISFAGKKRLESRTAVELSEAVEDENPNS